MKISHSLISWYSCSKRDLPWRDVNDPYRIWVSEIILQQTRVKQGLSYYLRFIDKFPDIHALAGADENEVLKVWEGLGYYSRARNMLIAARQISSEHGGRFPDTYDELRALRGVGDYTAAAIASIAFGLPYPVIDGNVKRVVSRLLGIQGLLENQENREWISVYLQENIDRKDPGTFNQAIMELGALVCKPSLPDCGVCPLSINCEAYKSGLTHLIPFRKEKTGKVELYRDYFVMFTGKGGKRQIFISKDSDSGIWKGLSGFPFLQSTGGFPETPELQNHFTGILPLPGGIPLPITDKVYRHVLTHRIIHARFHFIEAAGLKVHPEAAYPVPLRSISQYPFPRLLKRFMEEHPEMFKKKLL